MNADEVRRDAFAMPLTSPAFPRGPCRFVDCEFLIGSYRTESGQVFTVSFEGQAGGDAHAMVLDDEAPTAGGRELCGFPKKRAAPSLTVDKDTLLGTLDHGSVRVATAPMGYKHRAIDTAGMLTAPQAPNDLLTIIPHVDGTARSCALVRYFLEDNTVMRAWTGPAALEFAHHARAPVDRLPVLEVLSGTHLLTT